MKIPKVMKLVHIPMTSQDELEAIKKQYGITHTDVIIRGIQLATDEVKKINGFADVKNLYQVSKTNRVEKMFA